MTVNTYWHDWNLNPWDYLTTSSASSTYVPYTGAGTAVDSAATFTWNVWATAYTIGDIVLALKTIGIIAS